MDVALRLILAFLVIVGIIALAAISYYAIIVVVFIAVCALLARTFVFIVKHSK